MTKIKRYDALQDIKGNENKNVSIEDPEDYRLTENEKVLHKEKVDNKDKKSYIALIACH